MPIACASPRQAYCQLTYVDVAPSVPRSHNVPSCRCIAVRETITLWVENHIISRSSVLYCFAVSMTHYSAEETSLFVKIFMLTRFSSDRDPKRA